jgi:hypothetical protein
MAEPLNLPQVHRETGNLGLTDEEQLVYACKQKAAIFTHDTDFLRIAAIQSHVIRQAVYAMDGNLKRVNERHIEAIKRVAMGERPQARFCLANRSVIKRTYGRLTVSKSEPKEKEGYCYVLDRMGSFEMDALDATI